MRKERFYLSIYLLVLVRNEYILETVFHRLYKRLEFRQNTTSLRVVFSTLFSVFGYSDETLSLVFDILPEVLRVGRDMPLKSPMYRAVLIPLGPCV